MDFFDAVKMDFLYNKMRCSQIIAQCTEYTHKCAEIFKRSCDMLIVSKKIGLYLEKYGYPYFSKTEQELNEIDGHIKVLLNIDCKEIGRMNCAVNVFVDNNLEENEIIVGLYKTDKSCTFELSFSEENPYKEAYENGIRWPF